MILFFPFRFLYQIFPGTTLQCQRLLFKAAKTGELDTVQKLVSKFLSFTSAIVLTSHAWVGGYVSNDFFFRPCFENRSAKHCD